MGTFNLSSTSTSLLGQIYYTYSTNKAVIPAQTTVTAKIKLKKKSATTTGHWDTVLRIGKSSSSYSTESGNVYKSVKTDDYYIVLSYSKILTHNTDGSCTAYIYGKSEGPSGTSMAGEYVYGSKTISIPSVPVKSTFGDFTEINVDEAFYIPVEKQSDSFYDTLSLSINGIVFYSNSNYNDDTDILLTTQELGKAYKLMSGFSDTLLATVETFNGSTSLGSNTATAIVKATGTLYKDVDGALKKGVLCKCINGNIVKLVLSKCVNGNLKRID